MGSQGVSLSDVLKWKMLICIHVCKVGELVALSGQCVGVAGACTDTHTDRHSFLTH